ncbi:MAG: HAD family phosphatase [Muricomes sp.]|uniref:HAD family hydrolase n=1 Tax=Faecalicatena contorta TaxID=39482 RepID=UPI002EA6943A|nr:HAD family phosphatase [Muricomes sp.]
MGEYFIPGFGQLDEKSGFISQQACSDGHFCTGREGVNAIYRTGDKKVELVCFADRTIAYINSAVGYSAYYPVYPIVREKTKAVLMDLDGTTVKSEEFWIWIIEKTVQSLLDNQKFSLTDADIPFVSGHSVTEHLKYCIDKYCPEQLIEKAREFYFYHTNLEMKNIMEGKGRPNAFVPTPGVKQFLLKLKEKNMKIGLVTSGLYEKAYPEILSAFQTMEMGDPKEFYDSIITAGSALGKGRAGTLGELEAKPHPWLYAETANIGLGIPFEQRGQVIGIEDSGAGASSIRLAGYYTVGIGGGNIKQSGTLGMCNSYCETFDEILDLL